MRIMYIIIMIKKYVHSGIILSLAICCFSCQKEDKAKTIVLKALEAHGGIDAWKNAKELVYTKTTILYDSLGKVEHKLIQKHRNTFVPNFEAQMEWEEDSIVKKVTLIDDKTKVYFNGEEQDYTKLQEKYSKAMIAANYVIWQPYKLLDKEAILSYQGTDTLDRKEVDVVKADYRNEDGSYGNSWWYYFNKETNRLLGNMVHHGTTYSFINNIKYENETGLSLNAYRKSYRTDSLRNVKFLRAEYYYDISYLK